MYTKWYQTDVFYTILKLKSQREEKLKVKREFLRASMMAVSYLELKQP